jgi:hypothetical protein
MDSIRYALAPIIRGYAKETARPTKPWDPFEDPFNGTGAHSGSWMA